MSYAERDSMHFIVTQMDAEIIKELRADFAAAQETIRLRTNALVEARTQLQGENATLREKLAVVETDLHGIARAIYPHKEPHFTYSVPFMVEEIAGLQYQVKAANEQIATLREKLTTAEALVDKSIDSVMGDRRLTTLTERAEKAEARDFLKGQQREELADTVNALRGQVSDLTQERDTLAAQAGKLREALEMAFPYACDSRCQHTSDLSGNETHKAEMIRLVSVALSTDAGSALAELRELREDKERLDWLNVAPEEEMEALLNETVCDEDPAVWRAAIDAARK